MSHRLSLGLFEPIFDLVFPPHCVVCGAGGALLCKACAATIRAPEPPLCLHCGVNLGARDERGEASTLCERCATGRGPASLTALRVAAVYEGAVRQAILALKFQQARRVALPLGDLLAAQVHGSGWRPEVVLPVPLHPDRARWRGYNQAELLARRCARGLGVAYRADLLVRSRDTRSQVGLSLAERRVNVAEAFALASPAAAAILAGRRILLVDDVATTGSTLDAAAATLVAVRPAAIWGVAVSRPDLVEHNEEVSEGAEGRSDADPQIGGSAR